jgi:U3 small nucleolar RNA-associated protein 3
VGATPAGLQYLVTKSMLQASKALNLSLYLLLKAEQASSKSSSMPTLENNDNSFLMEDDIDNIQSHPVMDRLNQLSQLTDKLKEGVEDKTPGLKHQMESLVKAAALMNGEEDESDEDSSADKESVEGENVAAVSDDNQDDGMEQPEESNSDRQSEASSDEEEQASEAAIQSRILTEAKFALRNQDIDTTTKSSKRSRRLAPSSMDYGDDAEEVSEKALEAGRKLASTMNSIAQKSSGKGKQKQVISGEDEDDEYERLQRGLAMMDDEFDMSSNRSDGGDSEGEEEDEGFADEDDDNFYSKVKSKSKAKKLAKKQMYAVAPKYPRLEEEVEGRNTKMHDLQLPLPSMLIKLTT